MRTLAGEVRGSVTLLLGFVGLLWLVELIDLVALNGALDALGIRPRDTAWLWGIALAPLLHAGLPHLVANTAPLLALGWLVLLHGRRHFVLVTALVALLGGLGVWLLGRPNTVHIGASGVIFGYLGYLLLRGWFQRSLGAIAIAVVVVVLYGGALVGVLPGQRGVSWEGHLFGFAGGAGVARVTAARRRADGKLPLPA
jgi:membrane associated rhomboid family serine protease